MPKKEANKNNKDKKHFFKDFKAELKKVSWLTPKQLVNNTVVVISIVLLTAVIVFALDLAFETINTYGIEKIKAAVATDENTTETQNETGNGEVEENNTTSDVNEIQEDTAVNNEVQGNEVEE